MSVAKTLNLKIHSPKGILFSGAVYTLTSENDYGEFDILYAHRDFISLIFNKVLIKDLDNKKKLFKISDGILKCVKNNIDIYLKIDQL